MPTEGKDAASACLRVSLLSFLSRSRKVPFRSLHTQCRFLGPATAAEAPASRFYLRYFGLPAEPNGTLFDKKGKGKEYITRENEHGAHRGVPSLSVLSRKALGSRLSSI